MLVQLYRYTHEIINTLSVRKVLVAVLVIVLQYSFNNNQFIYISNLPPLFYLNCGGRPVITRAYNPDNYFSSSSSRLVILLRLIARVEALWNSAEVVGWIIPPTPRSISIRLNDTIKR